MSGCQEVGTLTTVSDNAILHVFLQKSHILLYVARCPWGLSPGVLKTHLCCMCRETCFQLFDWLSDMLVLMHALSLQSFDLKICSWDLGNTEEKIKDSIFNQTSTILLSKEILLCGTWITNNFWLIFAPSFLSKEQLFSHRTLCAKYWILHYIYLLTSPVPNLKTPKPRD